MVDTIKFSEMTDGGDIDNNKKVPGLKAGGNVLFNNPWTFLPPGTTAQRPTPSAEINYRLRFNTDEQLYEYYDAILGMWTQLQESAFTVGPFITYTADASLPDAQNLGALANGILKQTITLGVATLDIAVNGTDYYGPGFVIPPADGGTGINNGTRTINLGSPTTGYILTSDVSGNATWQSISGSGAILTIDGDSGSATPTAGVLTIAAAATGLSFTGSGSTLALGGLLTPTFGGLGVSNPTAHGILVGEGASAVTPIVLGAGQILIGTTASDPVAGAIGSGTGILVGNSSGSITVSLAAIASHDILSNITGGSAAPVANTLSDTIDAAIGNTQGDILYRNASGWVVLPPSTSGFFLQTQGAAANPAWAAAPGASPAALTKTDDTNVTMTLGGSPTVALLAATSMTLGWTGQLSLARGGMNANLTASNGGIFYSTASAGAILSGTATANQILLSGASGAPSWSVATYPSTAGTSGNVLTSDGTNWISSAPADAKIIITDDTTTNATMFPTWVTANTGTLPLKVTSTKLFYNPSTSLLTNVGYLGQVSGVKDSSGNIIVNFGSVASAVNYLELFNRQTGQSPTVSATGSDAAVNLLLQSKAGGFVLRDNTATNGAQLAFQNAAGSFATTLQVPAAQATNCNLQLPALVPSVNNAVTLCSTAGVLSFSSVPYPAAVGWSTFTPTVTLVGGAGNTVPTYTTNIGRYTQVGNIVFVNIFLNNTTGGTAGAGTGVINIALPVTSGSGITAGQVMGNGTLLVSTAFDLAVALVAPSASTVTLAYQSTLGTQTTAIGNSQNQAIRQIALSFAYEV